MLFLNDDIKDTFEEGKVLNTETRARMQGYTDPKIIQCFKDHPDALDDETFKTLIAKSKDSMSDLYVGDYTWDHQYETMYILYHNCCNAVLAFMRMQKRHLLDKATGDHDVTEVLMLLYTSILIATSKKEVVIEEYDFEEIDEVVALIRYVYGDDCPVDYLWK